MLPGAPTTSGSDRGSRLVAQAALLEAAKRLAFRWPAFSKPPALTPQLYDTSEAILLQGFGWQSWSHDGGWYNFMRSKVPDIKAAGFTHVWLPPPSHSVSREGYLPCEMYDLDTPYGCREELKALCAELNAAGIVPLADVVINHRSAGAKGPEGLWNVFTDSVPHPGERLDWGPWAITSHDSQFGGTGSADTESVDFGPAPDVDHANEAVRRGYKDWLRWLSHEIGFGGFRLDYVKGYAPHFVREYLCDTLGPAGSDQLHVGEYWTDLQWEQATPPAAEDAAPDAAYHPQQHAQREHVLAYDQDRARQQLCDYLDGCSASTFMFDFPTKGILNEAVKHGEYDRLADPAGKQPGLVGWWPQRAVTFIDNHDTGSTQRHWPFPDGLADQGFAYILTHPGVPALMWEQYEQHRGACDALIALRRRHRIHSESRLDILAAEPDMYVACVDGRVVIKMGPRLDMGALCPVEEDGWYPVASGNGWAVWERLWERLW